MNSANEILIDEIVHAIEEINTGDRQKTIAARDEQVAALLTALDESEGDELVDLGHAFQDALGRDHSEDLDRSDVIRLAFRVALQESAPDVMDQLETAVVQHTRQNI